MSEEMLAVVRHKHLTILVEMAQMTAKFPHPIDPLV